MNTVGLKDVLEYYDSVYGTKSNPQPKRIAIFEESGIVQFGKNSKHTEATKLSPLSRTF